MGTGGSLLTGELDPTNEPYAVAKIAGTDFISVMPTNLYEVAHRMSHGTV